MLMLNIVQSWLCAETELDLKALSRQEGGRATAHIWKNLVVDSRETIQNALKCCNLLYIRNGKRCTLTGANIKNIMY